MTTILPTTMAGLLTLHVVAVVVVVLVVVVVVVVVVLVVVVVQPKRSKCTVEDANYFSVHRESIQDVYYPSFIRLPDHII